MTTTIAKRKTAIEPTEVLDPIRESERLASVAYSVSGTATFALRAIAHDGKTAEPIRSTMRDFADQVEEWPAFVRDIFGRLYDHAGCGRLADTDAVTWAIGAANAAEQQEGWADLCAAASCSRSIAARATEAVARAVAAALQMTAGKKVPEPERTDPRARRRDLQKYLEACETEEAADLVIEQMQEELGAAADARTNLDNRFQRNRHQVRSAIAKAAAQAKQEADLLRALLPLGFSLEGPSSLEQLAPGLAEKLRADPRIAKILLQAGRMYDAARGAKAAGDGNIDVVGIHGTGDIAATTSAFRARFTSPGLIGDMALLEIMDGTAQGHEMRDEKPRERGDIIYLSDRSGSMAGDREIATRSLGIALMMAAAVARRRIVVGTFAGRGDCKVVVVKPGDTAAAAKALADLCIAADGGTDVEGAIVTALASATHLRSPDIIVATDGVFPAISKETMRALTGKPKERCCEGEARVMAILIGQPESAARAHPEFTRVWCVASAADAAAGVMAEVGGRR